MKVLVKAPLSPYSGYGNDGLGIVQALAQAGLDVYLDPTHVTAPLPQAVANLLTKRLQAPFDLLVHHVDPAVLGVTKEIRRACKVSVGWSMWEFTNFDNFKGRRKLRTALKSYDTVFGYDPVSSGALAEYMPKTGKLDVLQGGFWPAQWPYQRRDWRSDRFGFCLVGALGGRKDPFLAIQAFKELKEEHPEEFDGAELHLKAQPLDARVLTPTGWVSMGELEVGDVICDAQGGTQVVQAVYPQGEQDIYEVRMSGGARTRCTADHLWLSRTPYTKTYRVKSLAKMMGDGLTAANGLLRHRIPLTVAVKGAAEPCRHERLDPYVLGLLLGDGGFTQSGVHYSSADDELVKAVADCVSRLGCVLVKTPTRQYDYRVVRINRTERNQLTEIIRALGLMAHRSSEKFVPADYLFLPADARLELLRGLMDTDGTVGTSVTFSTTSPMLAEGVTALVRSLGGVAACTTPYVGRRRVSDGTYRDGAIVYPVRMTLDVCPFRLARKALAWEALWAKRRHSYENKLSEVRFVGRAQAQCIKVSGPENTYVTDDYIVTHNTNVPGMHSAMEQWIPKLRVHYSVWPDDVLREFYAAQHCLISASRGEGKNMPALEMMSTGGTVIATNWGGHTQWLSREYAYPLDYVLAPQAADTPNCLNARASKEHLKQLMLHVYRNRDDARKKGDTAARIIPQMCSWTAVIDRLFTKLGELGADGVALREQYRFAKERQAAHSGPLVLNHG